MYLDYSKLEFDRDGFPETPVLVLKTLSDRTIGVIPGVHNLKLNVKFSEPSEISFDIPAYLDGRPNPLYRDVTGYKQLYTRCYGVYELLSPTTEADGILEVKHVKGYSYEKTLESKKLLLPEGMYNFWNPVLPQDTVLGRILERALGWSPGYVSPSLIGRYRSCDQYDDYLLPFMYNTAPEAYRCVFVFDTYKKTINVYDADEERPTLPIYLDFDNLLETLDIEEKSDELVTALRPYGADELSIRAANPLGTDWMYDLSYFIANGDIKDPLASKWNAWQRELLNRQSYYRGLIGLKASIGIRLLEAQAKLKDLNGELETLTAQQSQTIQALALEVKGSAGAQSQQAILDGINQRIADKKKEIQAQEDKISSIEAELDPNDPSTCEAGIQAIVNKLTLTNYFTTDEYRELSSFFIEQDVTEESFVASDLDESVSGSFYPLSNDAVSIEGAAISEVDLTASFQKKMYVLSGGSLSLSGSHNLSCDIIRGTLESASNGDFVLSLYAGTLRVGDKTAPSGSFSLSGKLSSFTADVSPVTTSHKTDSGQTVTLTTNEGTKLSFRAAGSMYLTGNVSEYQRYSVAQELFEYGAGVLKELATPTYEFSVDAGNFLFAKEFAPFRNKLELGKGVYLNIGGKRTITPYIIEFELDFEERNKFSIIFSNRFKRHDNVNTLKDMIESGYSSGRSFDASKYIYNQAVGQASAVSKFMSSSLEAAKNTILAAANQSVIINGAGIHVGGQSRYQIRIVDSMIAMSDDNWSSVKLAIGHFASPEIGEYFGVNAEVIGGKLIVGNNLIIENTKQTSGGNQVVQFRVDASGAWLQNATFVLQEDNGGRILLDPRYGIAAGGKDLFSVNGTTVTPGFVDAAGRIVRDAEGMPVNANFYLDLKSGGAYFRGRLCAKSGEIGGFTIEEKYLHSGSGSTYVALNGSGTNQTSAFAIWAGAENPNSAPFWVKRDGSIFAQNGTFMGTLKAATVSGNLTSDGSGWLVGAGIKVGQNSSGGYNFYVDPNGNVTMNGDLTLRNGAITWADLDTTTHNNIAYQGSEDNIFNVLTNNGTKLGIFHDSDTNGLYVNATYIHSGTIDTELVSIKSAEGRGGIKCGKGKQGGRATEGIVVYGPGYTDNDGKPVDASGNYIIVTDAGIRLSQKAGVSLYLDGTHIVAGGRLQVEDDIFYGQGGTTSLSEKIQDIEDRLSLLEGK